MSATTRRGLLRAGIALAGGAVGLGGLTAAARQRGWLAPDYGGAFGLSEVLTYGSQRALMAAHSLAREFSRSEISKVTPVNGPAPEIDDYQRLLASDFADWRLTVTGLVARPSTFSLPDLTRLPPRTQITHQACEEGWSFIAEWTGVPLALILDLAGIQPSAKYVVFYPFDMWWDSLDIVEVRHPQTLLAYAMNGRELPADHGAPLRLRVPRQLGYKSIKYLRRIEVVDRIDRIRNGKGSQSPDEGYSWYAGI
jgi:DMSO/TMAO reductase YedYZ molybdopterin-dependent catalytic subunit